MFLLQMYLYLKTKNWALSPYKEKNEDIVLMTTKPYSQSIYFVENRIYIQDDDFKQISMVTDQNRMPLFNLLQNTHQFESIECG